MEVAAVIKWEYCQIQAFSTPYRIVFMRANGAQSIEIKRDRSKGDHDDNDAYQRAIAELGMQGWEAIGYQGQTGNILFKRPLP